MKKKKSKELEMKEKSMITNSNVNGLLAWKTQMNIDKNYYK